MGMFSTALIFSTVFSHDQPSRTVSWRTVLSRVPSRTGGYVIAGLILLLTGCSSISTDIAPPVAADLRHVMQAPPYIPDHILNEPEVDLLGVTPEMRAFVQQLVPEDGSREHRLDTLFSAFGYNAIRPVIYDPRSTLIASEVFETGKANCLAFSAMFIALAREAGLEAYFQEVDVPPAWDAVNYQTLVQYRHVNVKVKVRDNRDGVVDLRMDRYSQSYPQRQISDNTGRAHYYSNMSMQYVLNGDLNRAYVAARRAIQADDSKSFIWNNMGIVQRRLGYPDLAEASYRQAIQLDPHDWSAINNLAYIYEFNGDLEKGTELRELANGYRMDNPYYNYAMAQSAYHNADYEKAVTLVNEALTRYRREHRFYYLRGLSLWQLGDSQAAIKDVKRAIKMGQQDIASHTDEVADYRQQLAEWQQTSS